MAGPADPQQTLRVLRSTTSVPATHLCCTAARTHVGHVRQNNEDQYLVASVEHHLDIVDVSLGQSTSSRLLRAMPGLVLAVADGVGGLPGGELASAMVIDTLAQCALRGLPVLAPGGDALLALQATVEDALAECQTRMRATAARKGLDERIATTVTLAYVQWPSMCVLHVGDSRAYLLRAGELSQITRDQTLAQRLRDAGETFAREDFEHILTNSVGGSSQDLGVQAHATQLLPGDRVLLCTDGLYGELDAATIATTLASAHDQASTDAAADRLMEAVLKSEARDNATFVIACFH